MGAEAARIIQNNCLQHVAIPFYLTMRASL
jgi:hypothetical protein